MSFLSAMLPGLRELRPIIAGGFLWLAAGYFALGWAIPARSEIDTDPDSLAFAFVRLVDALGTVGSAGALAFVAFAVGSVTERFGLADLSPRIVRERYLRNETVSLIRRLGGLDSIASPAPSDLPEHLSKEFAALTPVIYRFALDNGMGSKGGRLPISLRLFTRGVSLRGHIMVDDTPLDLTERLNASELRRIRDLARNITTATTDRRQLRHGLEIRIARDLREEPLARDVVYRTLAETQLRVAISVPGALLLISLGVRISLDLRGDALLPVSILASAFALLAWTSAMQDNLNVAMLDANRMIDVLSGRQLPPEPEQAQD